MKKLLFLLIAFITVNVSGQNIILKPVNLKTDSTVWVLRPTVGISGIKLQYVGGLKSFEVKSCQSFLMGVSYQKFSTPSECDLALNGGILYNVPVGGTNPIDLGIAFTAGAFNNLISAGIGWDFKEKYPCLLFNISLNLN
jgi:hypothetical protein